MISNWWHRVAIHKTESSEDQTLTLRFEHPTVLGTKTGGWMERMKDEGKSITQPDFGDTKILSASLTSSTKPINVKMTKEGLDRIISLSELEAHGPESTQPWFIVNAEVYDGTA